EFNRLSNSSTVTSLLKTPTDITSDSKPDWYKGPSTDWEPKTKDDYPFSGVFPVSSNPQEIESVSISEGLVTSIQVKGGRSVYPAASPMALDYLYAFGCPIIGFMVPWGAVKILVWIGMGFSQ
ncbi:MAG TPA: hypothetical protein VHA14_05565, partial [Bryobacteraceae bacterium]|nr:hypothetical protein [Bryobacteraceae bacterium]